MQVMADYHEAQRILSGLKTLCEEEQYTEALNRVKDLEASLQTITTDPEWNNDEHLKSIVRQHPVNGRNCRQKLRRR